ncbi:MAG: hypothetical protein DRQ51_03110 [Gammaproteobacteria bacterium]|nr:MAG: hypothetical protein DRQ51_03110 [Gammaproteobacteria bacterium]
MKKDEFDFEIDVCGFLCPLPIIKIQNFVGQLKNKDVLKIIASDKGVLIDVPIWCKINNYKFLGHYTEKNKYYLMIQVNDNVK